MSLRSYFNMVLEALRCGRPGCRCQREPANGQVMVHCPAHPDDRPSLSLSVTPDGRLLVKCFAGCPQDRVITELRARGLWPAGGSGSPGPAGLTLEALAEAKRLPVDYLRELGCRDLKLYGRPVVAVPYFGVDGTELAVRYRLALHGPERFRWQKGAKVLPYGLQRLAEARQAGWLLLVEGESDCWTAWRYGVPALGVPGKSTWRGEWAAYLEGVSPYLWLEPEAEDLVERVARDVPGLRVIRAPDGVKDISEAHVKGWPVPRLIDQLKAEAVPAAEILRRWADRELAQLEAQARPVLEAPDPIDLVRQELRRQGFAGDLRPALVTYLAFTTRLLAYAPGQLAAHLQIIGPPSLGKSFAEKAVRRLLPPEACVVVEAGSPRVLIYDTSDLRFKALVFSEADSLPAGEDNPAASAVRSLLQENKLAYKVTIRDPETGEFKVKTIEKEGPTVLVTTSVRPLGGQLGTRLFTLALPEDPARIREILTALGVQEEDGPPPDPDPALLAFQGYLQRLAPWDVKVPFAAALARLVSKSAAAPRVLRDFQRLLALIKAAAVLRHRHRQRDASGRLLAELADYEMVFSLMADVYRESVTGLTEAIKRVVEAVGRLDKGLGVSYAEVARETGLWREQVKRAAERAVKAGWLIDLRDPRQKGAPACLRLGEPLPEIEGLPTPEQLAAELAEADVIEVEVEL